MPRSFARALGSVASRHSGMPSCTRIRSRKARSATLSRPPSIAGSAPRVFRSKPFRIDLFRGFERRAKDFGILIRRNLLDRRQRKDVERTTRAEGIGKKINLFIDNPHVAGGFLGMAVVEHAVAHAQVDELFLSPPDSFADHGSDFRHSGGRMRTRLRQHGMQSVVPEGSSLVPLAHAGRQRFARSGIRKAVPPCDGSLSRAFPAAH